MNAGFKSLPKKLYSQPVGITETKKLAFFGLSNPKEVFYSIKDGNWNDPAIWETVSGRKGKIPMANDDVYVRNSITVDATASCINLFIKGYLLISDNKSISVNGKLDARGTLDMSGANSVLYLYGSVNYIKTFVKGTSSNVCFFRTGNQKILDLDYCSLSVDGIFKQASSDVRISKNLYIGSNGFDLSVYNLVPSNTTETDISGTTDRLFVLYKSGTGNIIFYGLLWSVNFAYGVNIDFSGGNPTLEFRKGISLYTYSYNFGTGAISFTTNNQNIGGNINFQNPITIAAGIEVSITSSYNAVTISNSINGLSSTSKLINKSSYLVIATDSVMSVGVFDVTTNANTVTYTNSTNLPFDTYRGLTGDGCTRTGNLTVLNNLACWPGGLTINNGNLEVDGSLSFNTNGKLYKTGTGNVLLKNGLNVYKSGCLCDFSSGNPDIELQSGGIKLYQTISLKSGTGTLSFTTANQSIQAGGSSTTSAIIVLDCHFLISGAITVTAEVGALGGTALNLQFNNEINGNNAASTFVNKTTIHYQSATRPMSTGVLDCSTYANTFKYNALGDQDVTGGTYSTLEFGGSGVKTLQGNVTVPAANYSVTGSATVNNNGYTLTLT